MKFKKYHKVDKNKVLQSSFQNFNQEQEDELTAQHYAELGFIQTGLKEKGVNLDSQIPKMGDTPDQIATSFKHAIDYTLAHRSQKINLLNPELDEKSLRKFARKVSDVLGGSLTNDQVLSGIKSYRDFGMYSKKIADDRIAIREELGREYEISYVSEHIDKHISMMDRIKAFRAEVTNHFKNFGRDKDDNLSLSDALVDTVGVFGLAASGAVKILGGESGKMKVDDKIDSVVSTVQEKYDGVKDGVEQKIADVKDGVEQKITEVVNFVDEKQLQLEEKIAVLKEKTVNFFPNLAKAFKQRVEEVANNVVDFKNKVVETVVAAKDKTIEVATEIKDKTVQTVNDGVDAVVAAKDKTVQTFNDGVDAVVAAKDKTVQTFNDGVDAVVAAKDKTVQTFNDGVDAVVAAKDKTVQTFNDGVDAVISVKNKTVDAVVAAKDKTVETVNEGVGAVKQVFIGDKQKHLATIRDFLEKRDAQLASKNTNGLKRT